MHNVISQQIVLHLNKAVLDGQQESRLGGDKSSRMYKAKAIEFLDVYLTPGCHTSRAQQGIGCRLQLDDLLQ